MFDARHDRQIVHSPFTNCHTFSNPTLPWSVAYFMDGHSDIYKAPLSTDQWHFLPKLFCACALLWPSLGALPMLAPRELIIIVFLSLCAWNFYPSPAME